MISTDNQRTSKRIPFIYTVQYGEQQPQETRAIAVNLSNNGIFIRAHEELPIGTKLHMAIHMGESIYKAEGTVVRSNSEDRSFLANTPTNGVAINFDKVDPKIMDVYDKTSKITLRSRSAS